MKLPTGISTWAFTIVCAVAAASALPAAPPTQPKGDIANDWPWFVAMPFFFFAVVLFLRRKHVFALATALYGAEFLAVLRPTLLAFSAFITLGVAGMLFTHFSTQSFGGYVMSGFAMSAGLGVLAAYLLSRRFPPRLI